MNYGGPRPGAGRKPKANRDEERLLTVRVPAATGDGIDRVASELRESTSTVVRLALREWLAARGQAK